MHQQPTLFDMASQMQVKKTAVSPQIPTAGQQNIAEQKQSRQFVLNMASISDLLSNPKFKTNITVGKMLKIIRSLIENHETSTVIAKKYRVEQSIVELIDNCIIYTD